MNAPEQTVAASAGSAGAATREAVGSHDTSMPAMGRRRTTGAGNIFSIRLLRRRSQTDRAGRPTRFSKRKRRRPLAARTHEHPAQDPVASNENPTRPTDNRARSSETASGNSSTHQQSGRAGFPPQHSAHGKKPFGSRNLQFAGLAFLVIVVILVVAWLWPVAA